MDFLIIVLILLTITLAVVIVVVGHGIWLLIAWFFRQLGSVPPSEPSPPTHDNCPNCESVLSLDQSSCICGWRRPRAIVGELLKDLAATERQVRRFYRSGTLDQTSYDAVIALLEAERQRLNSSATPPSATSVESWPTSPSQYASVTSEARGESTAEESPAVVVGSVIASDDEIVIEPVPSFLSEKKAEEILPGYQKAAHPEFQIPLVEPSEPRKSFSEMLNAFMEESNIRWGEIIGGLLIIGCSTALVVSLWSEISQIPVLKFLIFTTVTAALFGVGLYTEHRWKLPTTSRGILTTATLLVPLNFLAIAAVSSGESPGALVVGSELIAPAIFLCLVYFAGKVLTPSWPHLLVAGVLGSSIGQLLVRHFASPDLSPGLLVTLAAFPLACYVASVLWMLKKVFQDGEIHESETIAIFITLGTMTFAAILPFALLLYKTGPVSMTMMYVAPLVSFGGFPLLATGMFLWQRVTRKDLVATRTVGTSLAILGTVIVVAGMFLAWPNPASIVPAALFNFAVFTTLAVLLRLPGAHVPAAFCFALAYLVQFHVLAGNIAWQNLRVTSLLQESLSVSSGQALAPLFVIFLVTADWLRRKRTEAEGQAYLTVACAIAAISIGLVSAYGLRSAEGPFGLWPVYAVYGLGAFWIAVRHGWAQFSWLGSLLLLVALWQVFAQVLNWSFPWQTAFLVHASICAIAAIVSRECQADEKVLTLPLNWSALISSFVVVWCLMQAGPWQTTAMQAERVFWLAGIWLTLLWLNHSRKLFTLFQVAATLGVVLAIKATLQRYDWYSYLPHVFLHPWGLQIQGTALVLLSLMWVALRLLYHKLQFVDGAAGDSFQNSSASSADRLGTRPYGNSSNSTAQKLNFIGHLLDSRWSFDRFVLWFVLIGFVLLAGYGALSGITRELTAQDVSNPSWDIAGFPHDQILQPGSWILLGLIVIAFLVNLWERRRSIYLLGAVAALFAMVPLIAGTWEPQTATASAWRWFAALFLLLGSLPVWFPQVLAKPISATGWPSLEISRAELLRRVRILLLALSVTPILLLTIYPALRAIYYMPVHGPTAGFFVFLEESFSYGLPLVVVAAVMLGYALRQRLPHYAFAAGLFLNLTVTMAQLLSVVAVNGSMNRVVLAHTIQLNAIVFAVYAIVWLARFRHWSLHFSEVQAREERGLLATEISLAIAINVILILPVLLRLIGQPEAAGIGTLATGSLLGWLGFLLTVVAVGLFARVYQIKIKADALFVTLLGASCLIAFGFSNPDASALVIEDLSVPDWGALRAFLIFGIATAWLLFLARWLPGARLKGSYEKSVQALGRPRFSETWEADCLRYSTLAGAIAVFVSLRLNVSDSANVWWSVLGLFAMSVLFASLHWPTLKRTYLYAAGIVFSLATVTWGGHYFGSDADTFLHVQLVALNISSIVWLALELRARRISGKHDNTALSFHNLAAIASLFVITSTVLIRLVLKADGLLISRPSGLSWLAIATLALFMISCLWDRHARYAVASVYIIGLLFAGTLIDMLELTAGRVTWAVMISMSIYSVVAAYAWHSRREVMALTDGWNLPRRIDDSVTELNWLSFFQISSAAIVFLIAYWVVLFFSEISSRLIAALAVALIAITFILMAEGKHRPVWQQAAIAMLIIGAVLLGWSWLVPGITGTWLNRAVILMVEMFALTALYGLGLNKALERQPEWTRAAQACVPWIAGAGVVALLFSLATEVFYQVNFGAVRIKPLALLAIGLTLISGIFLCILFALSARHDPLKLSERGRMNYVYAAEVMLALLFMHIRLTLPWLFTGFFERYWPLVVMAIAYLGVGTAESLRRRKLLVLAQPIERTGAFLPLLPVIGFWLAQSEVDYSALLFIVGGLYGLLSILRRSFLFGVLAAVAGNGGLWYLLHRSEDFQFLQHPQLWLIPVALSVLVAAYLNEDDFTEEQMAGVRYLSLVTIYASSTSDIFINGVAESPWLPLVLAALSLAGIFCGIIFRIRGFLMLGSVFLLLAIITMIWYASANLGWTWLWYVAGIVTGATIIFMFAVFEKKRSEVLRVVEGLKEWDR